MPDAFCSFPIKWLDVHRLTSTTIPDAKFRKMGDYWDGYEASLSELPKSWTGTTRFQLVMPVVDATYMRLAGRDKPVRIVTSDKPEEIFPETWHSMSRSAREDAISQWEIDRPKRYAARAKRELRYPGPYDELADYNDNVKKVMSDLKSSVAPCMPLVMSKHDHLTPQNPPSDDHLTRQNLPSDDHLTAQDPPSSELGLQSPISKAFAAKTKTKNKKLRRLVSGLNQIYDRMVEEHREKVSEPGTSALGFIGSACVASPSALVHKQLTPKEWCAIPKPVDAAQAEYDQLNKINWVDWDNVCEYWDKCAEVSKTGKTMHFGRVFPLCHIKHSEVAAASQKHKGRVVFEGGSNPR